MRVAQRRRVAASRARAVALAAPGGAGAGLGSGHRRPAADPALAARVTDLTQTLSPAERAALEAKLADWEARTSNQLVVLIVPTTQPEPIESYSLRVAEKWKIGRKGQDNGALFLVAKNDRKMRIEVGYGLEGVLTDVTSRRIIAENVAPSFREGRYAAGIDAGVDRIIAVVGEGKPLPPPKATSAQRRGRGFESRNADRAPVHRRAGRRRHLCARSSAACSASTVGAGVVGAAAWFVAGSIVDRDHSRRSSASSS